MHNTLSENKFHDVSIHRINYSMKFQISMRLSRLKADLKFNELLVHFLFRTSISELIF